MKGKCCGRKIYVKVAKSDAVHQFSQGYEICQLNNMKDVNMKMRANDKVLRRLTAA